MQTLKTKTTDRSVQPLTLADYLAVVARRKWIVLLALVVVPTTAYLASSRQTPVFSASADVLLSRQNLGSQVTGIEDPSVFLDPARLVDTQAALARAPEVARRAVGKVGGETSPGALLDSSSVSARTNADLLTFSVSDGDPARAVRLTNAYAQAFIEYRRDLETNKLLAAEEQLRERLIALEEEGQQDSPLYVSLVEKEQQLRTLALLQSSHTLLRPATSSAQVKPQPRRSGIMGLALGLLLGLGMAFLWEALDRRVTSEDELEESLGLPVLGRLDAPPRARRHRRGLMLIDEPRSPQAESFRMLRTAIEFANFDLGARALMVTSAVKREGKSTTAANLAVAFAQAGHSVVLVDLDLRQPSVTSFFAGSPARGLVEVLRRETKLSDALLSVQLPEGDRLGSARGAPAGTNGNGSKARPALRVLPAGRVHMSDPSPLIASEALAKVFAELRSEAEFVFVDAPPLLAAGDARQISLLVDGVILVSRVGAVPRPALHQVQVMLQTLPKPVLGVVLTGSTAMKSYGYATYGYDSPSTSERTQAR